MRIKYIPAKTKLKSISFDTDMLPKNLGITGTIQHLDDLKRIEEYLQKKGIDAKVAGQVLGCDATVVKNIDAEAYVYVGTGRFHPIAVALESGKPVFVLNPDSMKLSALDDKDIKKILSARKGMLLKFYSSKNIGLLFTTKKGQSTVQGGILAAKALEGKYPDKKFYHFICETLDFDSLQNFPFIECWVNTMCPRIEEDFKTLNIRDIQ